MNLARVISCKTNVLKQLRLWLSASFKTVSHLRFELPIIKLLVELLADILLSHSGAFFLFIFLVLFLHISLSQFIQTFYSLTHLTGEIPNERVRSIGVRKVALVRRRFLYRWVERNLMKLSICKRRLFSSFTMCMTARTCSKAKRIGLPSKKSRKQWEVYLENY